MNATAASLVTGLDPDNDEFWRGVGEGRIPLRRCESCGTHFALPLPSCPDCGSADLVEVSAGGEGSLYSWVIVHYAWDEELSPQVPYVIGAVQLDEGARIFGRVEFVDHGALEPGLRLRATFPIEPGRPPIVFVPEVEHA
ncbi:Zn-ribbon domain-containing OB-fold protein [Aeromicrobium sp. HA]|uniref:Zn-ribbon domain-containing OB-fold protein n=1 Tax=Aeromicrobium sp. HA TaxID=3009077 RepID=UPI0022AFC60C|nr:OB-fold domain-containing protein [Aeromicrobium sp. HA]